ncbi:RNase H domain-containing protein [Nephila pilipes]|uniref:RNase H domain-containing protein n=1 Tax=Nephila pilipes TaxID=299642 RepID=A0A8X6QIJ4_NEPPI|nr:RNase H domain-containing protein [Nephila pilipes]
MSYSDRGIYFRSQDNSCQFNLRNLEGCSVFRSELIAIDSALSKILTFRNSSSIWILTDSRSAILHLSNWHRVGDNTGVLQNKTLFNTQIL